MMKKTALLTIATLVTGLATPPALSGTPVSQLAGQVGLKACADALAKIEKSIFKGRKFRTHHSVNTASPQGHAFNSISIKNYAGDDSHVVFTASPTAGGKCDVVYVESYTLNEDCVTIRLEAFSKYAQLGKMDETLVMQYQRDPQLLAYLTHQRNSNSCLITKRKIFYADK